MVHRGSTTMGGLGRARFMTPPVQSPLALGHRMRDTLGRGRNCLHPFQMVHVFSHLMYHERSFVLSCMYSFRFCLLSALLKTPPAY